MDTQGYMVKNNLKESKMEQISSTCQFIKVLHSNTS